MNDNPWRNFAKEKPKDGSDVEFFSDHTGDIHRVIFTSPDTINPAWTHWRYFDPPLKKGAREEAWVEYENEPAFEGSDARSLFNWIWDRSQKAAREENVLTQQTKHAKRNLEGVCGWDRAVAATAPQRCEVLLRTWGLWEETLPVVKATGRPITEEETRQKE